MGEGEEGEEGEEMRRNKGIVTSEALNSALSDLYSEAHNSSFIYCEQ